MDALISGLRAKESKARAEALADFASALERVEPDADFGSLCAALAACVADNNVKVAQQACAAIETVVDRFPDAVAEHSSRFCDCFADAFGNAKPALRDAARHTVLSIMSAAGADAFMSALLSRHGKHKNWRVRECLLLVFASADGGVERVVPEALPRAIEALGDAQPDLRKAAVEACAAAAGMMGLPRVLARLSGEGVRPQHVAAVQARFAERGGAVPPMAAAAPTSARGERDSPTAPRPMLRATSAPSMNTASPPHSARSEAPVPASARYGGHGGAAAFMNADDEQPAPALKLRPPLRPASAAPSATGSARGPALSDFSDNGSGILAVMPMPSAVSFDEAIADPAVQQLRCLNSSALWRAGVVAGFESDVGRAKPLPLLSGSLKELTAKINEFVSACATSNTDWKSRSTQMEVLRGLIAGGAAAVEGFATLIPRLRDPLCAQVQDLRSSIVRQACLLICELAGALGHTQLFEPLADGLVDTLLKLTYVTIAVIASSAHFAITNILHNTRVGFHRVLTKLTSAARTSKNPILRAHVAKYLLLACRGWSTSVLDRHADELQSALIVLLSDADADARKAARLAFHSFVSNFEHRRSAIIAALDASQQRMLDADLAEAEEDAAHALCVHVLPVPVLAAPPASIMPLGTPLSSASSFSGTPRATGGFATATPRDADAGSAPGSAREPAASGRAPPTPGVTSRRIASQQGASDHSETYTGSAASGAKGRGVTALPRPSIGGAARARTTSTASSPGGTEAPVRSSRASSMQSDDGGDARHPTGRTARADTADSLRPGTWRTSQSESQAGVVDLRPPSSPAVGAGLSSYVGSAAQPVFLASGVARSDAAAIRDTGKAAGSRGSIAQGEDRTGSKPALHAVAPVRGRAGRSMDAAYTTLSALAGAARAGSRPGDGAALREALADFFNAMIEAESVDPRSIARAYADRLPRDVLIPPAALELVREPTTGTVPIVCTISAAGAERVAGLLDTTGAAGSGIAPRSGHSLMPLQAVLLAALRHPHENVQLDALAAVFTLLDTAIDIGCPLADDLSALFLSPDSVDAISVRLCTVTVQERPDSDAMRVINVVPVYARLLAEAGPKSSISDDGAHFTKPFADICAAVIALSTSANDVHRLASRRVIAAIRRCLPVPTVIGCTLACFDQDDMRLTLAGILLTLSLLGDAGGPDYFITRPSAVRMLLDAAGGLLASATDAAISAVAGTLLSTNKITVYVDQLLYHLFKVVPDVVAKCLSTMSARVSEPLLACADANRGGSCHGLADRVRECQRATSRLPPPATISAPIAARSTARDREPTAVRQSAADTGAPVPPSSSYEPRTGRAATAAGAAPSTPAAPPSRPPPPPPGTTAAPVATPRAVAPSMGTSANSKPSTAGAAGPFVLPLTRENLELVLQTLTGDDRERRLRALHFIGRTVDVNSAPAAPPEVSTTSTGIYSVPPVHANDALWCSLFDRVVREVVKCVMDGFADALLGGAAPAASDGVDSVLIQTALSVLRKLFRNAGAYMASRSGGVFSDLFLCMRVAPRDLSVVIERTIEECSDKIPVDVALANFVSSLAELTVDEAPPVIACLHALTRVVPRASSPIVLAELEKGRLMDSIRKAFLATSTDVRRAVVGVLVELHLLLRGSFTRYAEAYLSVSQQKLLQIYIDKATHERGLSA